MLNFSKRETKILYFLLALLVFWVCWSVFLSPLLTSISEGSKEIAVLKYSLSSQGQNLAKDQRVKNGNFITLHNKVEQLEKIVRIVQTGLDQNGLKMLSFRQLSENNRLTIDVTCSGGFAGFEGFLEGLKMTDTFFLLDSAKVEITGKNLLIYVRLVSGYI